MSVLDHPCETETYLIAGYGIQEGGNPFVKEVQERREIYNDGSPERLDVVLLQNTQNLQKGE